VGNADYPAYSSRRRGCRQARKAFAGSARI
jgi:hypothetical protein